MLADPPRAVKADEAQPRRDVRARAPGSYADRDDASRRADSASAVVKQSVSFYEPRALEAFTTEGKSGSVSQLDSTFLKPEAANEIDLVGVPSASGH